MLDTAQHLIVLYTPRGGSGFHEVDIPLVGDCVDDNCHNLCCRVELASREPTELFLCGLDVSKARWGNPLVVGLLPPSQVNGGHVGNGREKVVYVRRRNR